MPSPKQIVVMVGLLGAAGAVWVPQFLQEGEDENLIQEEIPAILDEASVSFAVDTSSGEETPGDPGASTQDATAPSTTLPGAEDHEDRPLPTPTDGGSGPSTDGEGLQAQAGSILESIASSLNAVEDRRNTAPSMFTGRDLWNGSPTTHEVVVDSSEEDDDSVEDWQVVRNFLADNPVGGVLISEDSSLALVGSRVVRPGDRLAGGLLEIESIENTGIRYRFGETAVIHPISTFRATGSGSSEEGEEESQEDEEAAEGEESSEGDEGSESTGSTEGA